MNTTLTENVTAALIALKAKAPSIEAFFGNPLVIALREAESSAQTLDREIQGAFKRLEDANRSFAGGQMPNTCGILQASAPAVEIAMARTDMALKIANTIAHNGSKEDRAILAEAKLLR